MRSLELHGICLLCSSASLAIEAGACKPQLVWREREMVSSWHDLDEDVSTWQPRERRIDTACAVSRDADAVRFGGRFGWH